MLNNKCKDIMQQILKIEYENKYLYNMIENEYNVEDLRWCNEDYPNAYTDNIYFYDGEYTINIVEYNDNSKLYLYSELDNNIELRQNSIPVFDNSTYMKECKNIILLKNEENKWLILNKNKLVKN